jgi:hypothetical protein
MSGLIPVPWNSCQLPCQKADNLLSANSRGQLRAREVAIRQLGRSPRAAQAPAKHLGDEPHPVAAQGGARRSGLGACTGAAATGSASVRKDSTAEGSAAELGA